MKAAFLSFRAHIAQQGMGQEAFELGLASVRDQ